MSKPEYLDTLEDYVKAPAGTLIHDVPNGLYCYRKLANGYWQHNLGSEATSTVLAEDSFARKVQEFGRPPAPQVIRTVEGLEALDPETVLIIDGGIVDTANGIIHRIQFPTFGRPPILPAAVVATAAQVRAARKALEEA